MKNKESSSSPETFNNPSSSGLLFGLAVTLEKTVNNGWKTTITTRQIVGYRYTDSEDAAVGSFLRQVLSENEGFKAGQVLVIQIPLPNKEELSESRFLDPSTGEEQPDLSRRGVLIQKKTDDFFDTWPAEIQNYVRQMGLLDNSVKLEVLEHLHKQIGICLTHWRQEASNAGNYQSPKPSRSVFSPN